MLASNTAGNRFKRTRGLFDELFGNVITGDLSKFHTVSNRIKNKEHFRDYQGIVNYGSFPEKTGGYCISLVLTLIVH